MIVCRDVNGASRHESIVAFFVSDNSADPAPIIAPADCWAIHQGETLPIAGRRFVSVDTDSEPVNSPIRGGVDRPRFRPGFGLEIGLKMCRNREQFSPCFCLIFDRFLTRKVPFQAAGEPCTALVNFLSARAHKAWKSARSWTLRAVFRAKEGLGPPKFEPQSHCYALDWLLLCAPNSVVCPELEVSVDWEVT